MMGRDVQHLTQREFWVRIRRALLLIVDTIEDQYALPHVRSADLPAAQAPHRNGAAPQPEIPRQDAQSRSSTSSERDRN